MDSVLRAFGNIAVLNGGARCTGYRDSRSADMIQQRVVSGDKDASADLDITDRHTFATNFKSFDSNIFEFLTIL
jgi:hypothetical protein